MERCVSGVVVVVWMGGDYKKINIFSGREKNVLFFLHINFL